MFLTLCIIGLNYIVINMGIYKSLNIFLLPQEFGDIYRLSNSYSHINNSFN